MAAFMFLGAVIEDTHTEIELTYRSCKFVKPTIIEENYRVDLAEVAKRYRKIKSVSEEESIMIVPINDYHIGRKAILQSIITAEFNFGTLLELSLSSDPIIGESMYIESGLGAQTLDNLIPSWYTKASQRVSVRLNKTLETFYEPIQDETDDEPENPEE